MTEYNNIPGVEKLWKKLKSQNPENVKSRSLVQFDENGSYIVKFIDNNYSVNINNEKIKGLDDNLFDSEQEFKLLLLYYLVHSQEKPILGKWISEKGLPSGNLFFKGPHKLPEEEIIKRFGKNPKAFIELGKQIGGKCVDFGDAAIELKILPRIPIICILYIEDEEFSAKVNYLFDSSLKDQFPLDIILALVLMTSKKLIQS